MKTEFEQIENELLRLNDKIDQTALQTHVNKKVIEELTKQLK